MDTGSLLQQLSAKQVVLGLMGTRLKVFTADGRLISGVLTCLDKQGNVVLQHAAQHLNSSREERHLGTVIVPRDQRTKTQAMVMRNEAAKLQAQMQAAGQDKGSLTMDVKEPGTLKV